LILRTDPGIVPDEALKCLLYHEALHHLLPGEAHSERFLGLEAQWPDWQDHNLKLDLLHRRYAMDPIHYPNRRRSARLRS